MGGVGGVQHPKSPFIHPISLMENLFHDGGSLWLLLAKPLPAAGAKSERFPTPSAASPPEPYKPNKSYSKPGGGKEEGMVGNGWECWEWWRGDKQRDSSPFRFDSGSKGGGGVSGPVCNKAGKGGGGNIPRIKLHH